MADVAFLAVGLYLNNAFTPQLTAVYRQAGVGLSLGAVIHTSRQYSQALSDLSAITGATGEALKKLDTAAQQMGRTTEYSASQAAFGAGIGHHLTGGDPNTGVIAEPVWRQRRPG